jgi:hypothetical protein
MATTLKQIRFILERDVGITFEDDWILHLCNDAQSNFSLDINIPDTTTIALTTTSLSYQLPVGLKIINRLWLQSDFAAGIDKEFTWPYRIYSGKIIFRQPWLQADTLNVDFYKHMKYFTSIDDVIDLDDRFVTLYTYYCKAIYWAENKPIQGSSVRDMRMAMMSSQSIMANYNIIKQQVISYYGIQNEPTVIAERW